MEQDEGGLGAQGERLRLWKAREAHRQGELRMQSQALTLTAVEQRAQALLTWSVTIALAAGAAATNQSGLATHALFAVAGAAVTIVASIRGLLPKAWDAAGWPPHEVLDRLPEGSELEALEEMATRNAVAIKQNEEALALFAYRMRWAWGGLVFAAAAGLWAVLKAAISVP
jgi:hypothetical protein